MSIEIKKSHKGRFTKWSKIHGMTVSEAASKVSRHPNAYSEHVRKMAQFAQNAKSFKNKKAFGGKINDTTNLWNTDKRAWMDSTINSNTTKPWVRDLYNPNIKQPQLNYWSSEEDDNLFIVAPTINHLQDRGGIPFDSAEQAEYFIQNQSNKTPIPSDMLKERFTKKAMGGVVDGQDNNKLQVLMNRKFKMGNGGQVPVEVEGDEVAETPQGKLMQFNGQSHEEGGIDTSLPEGTNVFSDRLSIDGKTMAERKVARERAMNKLKKAGDRRPVDGLVKNATKRQSDINAREEQADMLLQEVAAHTLAQPQETKKAAYGGTMRLGGQVYDIGGEVPSIDNVDGSQGRVGNLDGLVKLAGQGGGSSQNPEVNLAGLVSQTANDVGSKNSGTLALQQDDYNGNKIPSLTTNGLKEIPAGPYSQGSIPQDNIGTGDYGLNDLVKSMTINTTADKHNVQAPMTAGNIMGIAGTAVNAISPLLTTKNYWKNRVMPTNPYLNYNHDALETNDKAMNQLAGMKDLALASNMRNRTNSINRNNESTRSLNTQRALNSGTDIAFDEDNNKVNLGFADKTMNILNQRANLQTQRDSVIAQGRVRQEDSNKADVEGYYTALNKDYGNIGTGLQKEGLALNEQQHNQDFLSVLPMLSKYGLGITYVNGQPKLVKAAE